MQSAAWALAAAGGTGAQQAQPAETQRADDELTVKVLRDGQPQLISYRLEQRRPLVPVLHGVDCVPSYFIVGGLVFVPLSIPFLEHAYGCAPCLYASWLSPRAQCTKKRASQHSRCSLQTGLHLCHCSWRHRLS